MQWPFCEIFQVLTIEQQYQERMRALTPKDRIARSVALFNWSREIIARQIQRELGTCRAERLKWEVAMRQYGSDPQMRIMIQRILDHVSD